MNKLILAAALAACFTATTIAIASEEKPGHNGVAEETARFNKSKNLTPEQVRAIVAEKSAGQAQRAAEMRAEGPRPAAASPFRGVIDAADVPNPFRPHELTILNFWGGVVNGKQVGVYAGYRPDDPAHGVLVVFDDKDNTRGTRYELPSAPLAILSESNGVLMFKGHTFDLGTRRFK